MSVETRTSRWDDLKATARPIAAALVAGFLVGAVVGGLGGRLAMFVLRLTSDPSLRGLETDDGFTIGVISVSTLFLVLLAAVLGAIGGVIYLIVRSRLPQGARAWIFGTLTGAVGGAKLLRPGGLDFTATDPLTLAVAMFIAILVAYGVTVSLLTERHLAREQSFQAWGIYVVAAAVLLTPVFGPTGIAIALVIIALFAVARFSPRLGSLWRSAPAVWVGRAALAGIGAVALVDLIGDVAEIL